MELKGNETEVCSINGPIRTKLQHTNLCMFRFIPSLPDGQNDWPKHAAIWNKSERVKVTVLCFCVECTADEVSFCRRPDIHCSGNKQTHYFQRASIPRSQIRGQPYETSNPQTSFFLYHVEVH
jgi:hypothetical protein